jgi:predicted site-specific integrase-resolvase
MPLERHYSLREAARLVGIDPRVLKRWLLQDLGILVPRVRRGGKTMIRERDVERVLEKRRDARAAIRR